MSLQSSVNNMVQQDAFRKILINPLAQFGRPGRELMGARFLPERMVPANKYTETNIKYRTVVANDGSRYSPAQKKGNDIVGTMEVSLADQDIASEFTAEDYDNHLAVANMNTFAENQGNPEMAGVVQITNWFDNRINFPLIEKIEKMRWEAIEDAVVPLRGDNDYSEDIQLSNPSGHRVATAGIWTSDSNNPLDDFFDIQADAADKGYKIGAFILGHSALMAALRNPNVVTAVGGYVNVNGSGALVPNTGFLTPAAFNAYLAQFELPPVLTYDLQYRTQAGTAYFKKRDVLVGLALTGRDENIDLGDNEHLPMRDTLGYVGIGRAAGQSRAGRATNVEYFGNKPPRAEFEGWQTSFPVITDPEAIYTRTGIIS